MAFTPDAVAIQQVQERLKSLHSIVHEIEKKRQLCEQSVSTLQKYSSDESGQSSKKIKSMCKTLMTQTEAEREVIQRALQKIYEIRSIKNERRIQARLLSVNKESIRSGTWMKMLLSSAQTLPLFVGKVGEKPPPLCGAIPAERNYIAKVGDMVAALVTDDNGENWILAEVVSFNHNTSKYEVDDILKEQNQEGRHTLNKKRVVPLTLMRANPETNPEALFRQGTLVLALFPQTTCFYKALINKPPATHMDEYEVLFEDSNYQKGYSPPLQVAQRYVIPFKQRLKTSATTSVATTSQPGSDNDSEDSYFSVKSNV
ncbi:SAGA-associated factor 29 [Cylas formicarius]|uniref:SAGA-associated factor 29 n=1 Tax=Cylas formicarius TaxID=197179 RepID=UPI002958CF46|nr:SAGA-associated factor 29 [Cylas formicarius]